MNKQAKEQLIQHVRLYKRSKCYSKSNLIENTLINSICEKTGLWPNIHAQNPLSAMESLCLILLATGYNPDQCADALGIRKSSVLTYERRLRSKLHARNRLQAFYKAALLGYLKLDYQKEYLIS